MAGPALLRATADPHIQRWHFFRVDTEEEAQAWIARTADDWASETSASWAIERADTVLPGRRGPTDGRPAGTTGPGGQAVGRISLSLQDLRNGLGAVSYWVEPQARRLGLASSAVRVVSTWAFSIGLHRLELVHSAANEASGKVAARAGFTFEGIRVSAMRHDDGWHDVHVHRLLAPD